MANARTAGVAAAGEEDVSHWKSRAAVFFTAALLALPVVAQDTRTQSIVDSYQASLGRAPSTPEINYWRGRQDWKSRDDLINLHLSGLRSNPQLQQEAVVNALGRAGATASASAAAIVEHWKRQLAQQPRRFDALVTEIRAWVAQRNAAITDSYNEALGRPPSAAELSYWQTRTDYKAKADLVQLHRQGIKSTPALGDEVVTNSYLKAFGRRPVEGELRHWRQHAKLGWTCTEMIAEHDKWKRSVPPTITRTQKLADAMKKQHLFLDTNNNIVKLDPTSAARVAGGSIVAAGSGNLVVQAGGYLIGMDGASIVAAGGGNIVAAGGLN